MKKLSTAEQKVLEFIGGREGVSLDEIKRWGALDFVRSDAVGAICRHLFNEGLIQKVIAAGDVTLYSAAK